MFAQIFGGTRAAPRIQSSIGEDNPRSRKVLLISDSSEMIESVVIIRFYAKLIVAHGSVAIVIEWSSVEHIIDTVLVHWHCLVTAGKDAPAAHVLIRRTVSIYLITLGLAETVVVLNRFPESSEELLIIGGRRGNIQRNA